MIDKKIHNRFAKKLKIILHYLFPDRNLSNFPKNLLNKKLTLLDVGARGGIGFPWSTAETENLNVILVEPDLNEVELLKRNPHVNILPYALWSEKTELVLNINNSPGTSSVLKSNMAFLKQFDDSKRFEANSKIKLNATTIDDLSMDGEIVDVDFMKIDIQGAELNVLKGGINFLKNNLIGLESEVEFLPIYEDQALFSEVEIFVREELGLELWDIRKTYWKYSQTKYLNPTKGRLIFGDALFLRPISTLDTWLQTLDNDKAQTKLRMLIAASIAYGYLDYSDALLNANFINKYLSNEDKKKFFKHIRNLHKSFYPFKNGLSLLYTPLQLLANCFKPTYKGFGGSDGSNHLGSRKKGFFWY